MYQTLKNVRLSQKAELAKWKNDIQQFTEKKNSFQSKSDHNEKAIPNALGRKSLLTNYNDLHLINGQKSEQFSIAEINTISSSINKFSKSLVIREMQIKSILFCHYTLLILAKMTRKENNEFGGDDLGKLRH